MKQTSKKINILTFGVVLTLIFLLSVNVAYAYFTAEDSLSGGFTFSSFEISFLVKEGSNISGDKIAKTTSLPVKPSVSTVVKGTPFAVQKESGSQNLDIYFSATAGSSDAYLRYWVDAYIGNDTSKNYGYCFELGTMVDGEFVEIEAKNNTEDATNKYKTYFMSLTSEANEKRAFNMMRLSNDVPSELLGSSLSISISFDAVQQANGAYSKVYTDVRGYYENWS